KLALEQLLGAPCYHMLEVLQHPEAVPYWTAAGRGEMPDWEAVFDGYAACVDWPAAAFWPEISAAYPDALVLLSTRASAEEWYRSAAATIFAIDPASMPAGNADLITGIFGRFTLDINDPEAAMAAYHAHNQAVRDSVPASRLIEWQPGEGWGPICRALGMAEPDEAFPHVNTTAMFQERLARPPEA
ncbi:MAG: sulfotransferase family protein, partial [Acidimicrobiales bacterium]